MKKEECERCKWFYHPNKYDNFCSYTKMNHSDVEHWGRVIRIEKIKRCPMIKDSSQNANLKKYPSKNYHDVFKRIRKSKFFKECYENKPLGDSIKIDE